MKRIFSLMLAVMMIAAVLAFSIPSSAAGDTLTVSVPGESPITVKVGQEFLVTTYLTVGPDKIVDGQGYTSYDAETIEYVAFAFPDKTGDRDPDVYSFPKLTKANLVSNTSDTNYIHFNFQAVKGATTFNASGKVADAILCRYRFKALKAGTTSITTSLQYMSNIHPINGDEENVEFQNVYYRGEANPDNLPNINPVMSYSLEKPAYLIGDADGDELVTIKDATQIQKIAAGKKITYTKNTADATGDNQVTLKDAVEIRAYLAGQPVTSQVGTPVFASETT